MRSFVTFETTVFSASMFAIATLTFFSTVSCVIRMMSVSPLPFASTCSDSFCSSASI
jgi:hypothetical protein